MQRTPSILIVGADPRLAAEVEAALGHRDDTVAKLHYVADMRQAVETARSRRPDLALVEMTADLAALKSFAQEVALRSPETTLAAVFSPDLFGPDTSDSAVLIEAIRAGIQDFLRRPLSRMDVEQLLERLYRRPVAGVSARNGRILSVVSNKGGVGKSMVATNLACGLAVRHPEQVLLVDASIQMGVCASLLDLQPASTLADAVRAGQRLDETLLRRLTAVHSCGLHLLAAPATALEAADIDDEGMSRVLTLARRAYDYVVVDTFPMVDRVMMAVLDLSDRSYIVLEGVVPTVRGAAQFLDLLDQLGYPRQRQRLVLSRYTRRSDNLRPRDVAERLGRDIHCVLPYTRRIAESANVGQPFALSAVSWWGAGRALKELVRDADAIAPLGKVIHGQWPADGSDNGAAK